MEKSDELLKKTLSDVELEKVDGGWQRGAAMIWSEVMGVFVGSCSWRGPFYGDSNTGGGGTCTRR